MTVTHAGRDEGEETVDMALPLLKEGCRRSFMIGQTKMQGCG